jgi:hypothetical protein
VNKRTRERWILSSLAIAHSYLGCGLLDWFIRGADDRELENDLQDAKTPIGVIQVAADFPVLISAACSVSR